ncbi:MAG: TIGR00282 family metallophosphoesterase [Chloroflexi bacterium]|nr:TIGR00282 family metallophosphoesterase [Chloroflexota bacterium]
MKVLVIGDVIGRPGRHAVKELLPGLRKQHHVDLVVANAENAAGGLGLTLDTADELLSSGVDVLTSGNHIWDEKEIIPHLDGEAPILRPLNYPLGVPGRGYLVRNGALVVNLLGRTFMTAVDCPFRAMDRLLSELKDRPPVVIVDLHAEATSEKGAMGWHLDGRASAVVGTHTHVGTVDARILPRGTACITDVGMVGPIFSVIGDEPEAVLTRFLTQMPRRLPVAKQSHPVVFNSVLIEIDLATGRSLQIARIDKELA